MWLWRLLFGQKRRKIEDVELVADGKVIRRWTKRAGKWKSYETRDDDE